MMLSSPYKAQVTPSLLRASDATIEHQAHSTPPLEDTHTDDYGSVMESLWMQAGACCPLNTSIKYTPVSDTLTEAPQNVASMLVSLSPVSSPIDKGFYIRHRFSESFLQCFRQLQATLPPEVFQIHGIATEHLDITAFSKAFFQKSASVADISVDGNANVNDKSIVQYIPESSKAIHKLNALYLLHKWVGKCFTPAMADLALERVLNGELFVNDLHHFSTSYCYSFDLAPLLEQGLAFFKGTMPIRPPKRSDSFIQLVIQATAFISNQIAGAIAYPSLFASLDWFYRQEHGEKYLEVLRQAKADEASGKILEHPVRDLWQKVKNQWQSLIYSFNFPFRSTQSAFTNVSVMDKGFMAKLFDGYSFPDGSEVEIPSAVGMSQLFFEYYTEIHGEEGLFTFPVMTLAMSLDEQGNYIDPEFVAWASEANREKCLANMFQSTPDSFSSCCRLRNQFTPLHPEGTQDAYHHSFGVGGLSIGSHRVCGLNLPRLAHLEAHDPERLAENLMLVHHILFAHRTLVKTRMMNGDLPLYTSEWMHLQRQYSTVGILGTYEYLQHKGLDIRSQEGLDVLTRLMQTIRTTMDRWHEDEKDLTGIHRTLYNLEQIPGETVAVRLAKLDALQGYNPSGWEVYSNQYVPLIASCSVYDRLRIQGHFDQLTSGGAICHLNYHDAEALPAIQMQRLLEHAKEAGVVYFALNRVFSQCENHHYWMGWQPCCPVCQGDVTRQATRVVGFLSFIDAWTPVRRDIEWHQRVFYNSTQLPPERVVPPSPQAVWQPLEAVGIEVS
ncbi:MAG: anaerobic ribonucleoside-triphosphate reductase [Vampirovibrionales bacterium]